MESKTMTQRPLSPILLTVALVASIGIGLSNCTSADSDNSSNPSSPAAVDTPGDKESAAPVEEAETAVDGIAAIAAQDPEGSANIESTPSNSKEQPSSSTTPQSAAPQTSSNGSAPPSEPGENESPNKSATTQSEPTQPETTQISIDETVCGAGGQEAYFETKVQEIYICKNEAGALTYIATPKKKGNSLFLPAQKVQQGELVGYAAIDDARTHIVTPGGYQLQDNGKPSKSEKVTRRQLAED